jgi:hypothetical protein
MIIATEKLIKYALTKIELDFPNMNIMIVKMFKKYEPIN